MIFFCRNKRKRPGDDQEQQPQPAPIKPVEQKPTAEQPQAVDPAVADGDEYDPAMAGGDLGEGGEDDEDDVYDPESAFADDQPLDPVKNPVGGHAGTGEPNIPLSGMVTVTFHT